MNYVHILSNVSIAGANIKWIQTYVLSGDIGSTESGTRRNTLRSMKIGPNQFVQP